jgi:hypothetical protein
MEPNETARIRSLVSDLVKIGFFRLSGLPTELSQSELAEIAAEESDFYLVPLEDGWYVTNWEDTLASQTLNRIAGVVHQPVPASDVAEALMRAVAYGPASEKAVSRRQRAKLCLETYDSMPSRAVLAHLCETVGASMTASGGTEMIDFYDVTYPVEPSEIEKSVLYALEESPYGAMQVSRLCRRVGRSRASTYHHIDKMPFILKDHRKAARIIGAEGHPEDFVSNEADFFGSFVMTPDSGRAKVELNANEECIESNSCNIPVECRQLVEGAYKEVNSGIEIRIDGPSGPDKRKVAGLSHVIRTHFKGYASKDKVYLILDKDTGEARVDVVSMHAAEKMAVIDRMFEEGIRQGPLLDAFSNDLGAAA